MAYTYLPTTTDIGKVRLAIGDNTEATAVFTDEELQVFLTAEGSVPLAAAAAARAWAAKYATSATSEKIGSYSYSQKIVDHLHKLADTLEAKGFGTPVLDFAIPDLTYNVVEED